MFKFNVLFLGDFFVLSSCTVCIVFFLFFFYCFLGGVFVKVWLLVLTPYFEEHAAVFS